MSCCRPCPEGIGENSALIALEISPDRDGGVIFTQWGTVFYYYEEPGTEDTITGEVPPDVVREQYPELQYAFDNCPGPVEMSLGPPKEGLLGKLGLRREIQTAKICPVFLIICALPDTQGTEVSIGTSMKSYFAKTHGQQFSTKPPAFKKLDEWSDDSS